MDSRINLLNRLRVMLEGHVYIGHRKQEDWSGELPFYRFRCPVHGVVENYSSGHDRQLKCPLCLAERGEKLAAAPLPKA